MNHLDLIKTGAGFVASISVSMIIKNAVGATTPKNINVINKTLVTVGALILGNMVGDAAAKYSEQRIDDLINNVKSVATVEGLFKRVFIGTAIKNSD
jgi:hypothetical protein